MRQKNIFSVLIFAIIICLGVVSCKNNKPSDKIKVGVIMPMTGDMSFYGELLTNSFLMSIDTAKVELIFEDSKGNIKDAITILNKFVSVDKIDVLVSFLPPICEALSPLCEKNDLLHFAFTQSPAIAKSNNTLKYWACSDDEARMFMKYIEEKGANKVSFLRHLYPDADLAFNTISKPTMQSFDISIQDNSFDLATRDFKNLTAKIKSSDPDIIVVQTLAYNYKNILTDLRNMKLTDRMIGDLNYFNVQDLNDFQDNIYENIPFVSMSLISSPSYYKYTEEYQEQYNKNTTVFGAFAYDLGHVLNNLNVNDLQKSSVINYYNENEVDGCVGRIIFDDLGNLKIGYSISQFKEGEITEF